MNLIVNGVVENISTRVDGSVKFTYGCFEMSPEMVGKLFTFRTKECKLLLSDSNITQVEIAKVDDVKLEKVGKNKSQSQRLRATLFKLHEQSKSEIDFDTFYSQKMETIIEHFKNKLNEAH